MKLNTIFFSFLICTLLIVGIFFYFAHPKTTVDLIPTKTCFGSICFDVEIAKSELEKQRGLMFRQTLEQSSGMLFVYDKPSIHSFWMKNTLIPLDIIWINQGKVVFLSHNTPPCEEDPCPVYTPDKEAEIILEINAGLAESLGITVGAPVSFQY